MASSTHDSDGAVASTSSAANAAEGASSAVASAGAGAPPSPNGRRNVPPALKDMLVGLPPRRYKLVALDMDTTGRRINDEIVHITAYAEPKKVFSQYIMPYGNLNVRARRRHNLNIVTVGDIRMLKNTATQRFINTKTDVAVLKNFLNFLEAIKSEDEKIILLYHEPHHLYPLLLLQSFIRYGLLDRFSNIMAGFADSYALCAAKYSDTFDSVCLRTLTTHLLDKKDFRAETAVNRAISAYKIIKLLANQEGDGLEMAAGGEEMIEFVREFVRTISTELEALSQASDSADGLKGLLEE